MNKITVDFDIVYKVTVMYCKLQFEHPMSAAEAMPNGMMLLPNVAQSSVTLFAELRRKRLKLRVKLSKVRMKAAARNLKIKCIIVIDRGYFMVRNKCRL